MGHMNDKRYRITTLYPPPAQYDVNTETRQLVQQHDGDIGEINDELDRMEGDATEIRNAIDTIVDYINQLYGTDTKLRDYVLGLRKRIIELEARAAKDDGIWLAIAALGKNVNGLYQHLGLHPPTPLDDTPHKTF